LGGKEVGGLLVTILQFLKRETEAERVQPAAGCTLSVSVYVFLF
jgi:hypothetical protein